MTPCGGIFPTVMFFSTSGLLHANKDATVHPPLGPLPEWSFTSPSDLGLAPNIEGTPGSYPTRPLGLVFDMYSNDPFTPCHRTVTPRDVTPATQSMLTVMCSGSASF